MGETRVQFIPNVTVQTNPIAYPRYIGEVLSHPYLQNTLLEVLAVWDGSDEVWGNLNEPIPFPYGSESNPITRDWNNPPPRRDESSKYPIYKCRVNGAFDQWIIFKWILLDENIPTDLLGYSNTQVASGNAIPLPPVLPNLPNPVRTEVTGWTLPISFEVASWTAIVLVPWTPSAITTQLWLDASDSSTVTLVSSAVSQWNDKSGNNSHVSQSTSGQRPLYVTNILNTLAGVRFDGGNDSLNVSVINTQSTNTSTFIVSKPSSTSIKGTTFKNGDGSSGYGIGYGNSTFDDNGNNFVYLREVLSWHPSSSYGGASANIVSSILGSSNIVNYLNGTTIQTIAGLPLAPAGTTNIGGYGGDRFFSGEIFEVVFCPSALSTIDRQKMEGYLAHKWGLTANLPSNHPYKTNPPMV